MVSNKYKYNRKKSYQLDVIFYFGEIYSKYGLRKARNLSPTFASALVAPNFTGTRDLSRKSGND